MFQSFIAAQRRFWWDFTISEPCCSTAFGVKFNTRFSFYLSCKYPWMEWMKTYIVLTLMNLLEVGWCNETCKVILQCQWQFSLIHVFLWRNLVWCTSFLCPKLEGFVTYQILFPDLDQVGGKIASGDHFKKTERGVGETGLAQLACDWQRHCLKGLLKNLSETYPSSLPYCCHILLYKNNLNNLKKWLRLFRNRFWKACHEFHTSLGGDGQFHDQGLQAAR